MMDGTTIKMPTLYLCDPKKNTKCTKERCYQKGLCYSTLDTRYKATGFRKIVLLIKKFLIEGKEDKNMNLIVEETLQFDSFSEASETSSNFKTLLRHHGPFLCYLKGLGIVEVINSYAVIVKNKKFKSTKFCLDIMVRKPETLKSIRVSDKNVRMLEDKVESLENGLAAERHNCEVLKEKTNDLIDGDEKYIKELKAELEQLKKEKMIGLYDKINRDCDQEEASFTHENPSKAQKHIDSLYAMMRNKEVDEKEGYYRIIVGVNTPVAKEAMFGTKPMYKVTYTYKYLEKKL